MTVERVGVSFEPELLDKFDNIIHEKGYMNRSEAIRDLVRDYLSKMDVNQGTGKVIGTITIIYDHDAGDVTNKLLHIQHRYHEEIQSTTHIHIDERNCLEVLVVRGKTTNITELANQIKATKGVKHVEVVLLSAEI